MLCLNLQVVPAAAAVQYSNVNVTTDGESTTVTYELTSALAGEGAVLIAALVNAATGEVTKINWTSVEDVSLINTDPKTISVSLQGIETNTVKLRHYLLNSLTGMHSLQNFAPAEPQLSAANAEIITAALDWEATEDDYDASSDLRYNIYNDGVLVNETPVSGLSYNVQNLVPGAEYYFNVKALDSQNLESDEGNTLKAKTYMPSTITTRIKPIEDGETVGAPSKDGNLVYGPLATIKDTALFYYKQDRTGGLNCFSTSVAYQNTVSGTPNYTRAISSLVFKLKNPVNADNTAYAYEFTYFDQCEDNGIPANIRMVYQMTTSSNGVSVALNNDRAWKTVRGVFTAAKPLSRITDSSAKDAQIKFINTHSWNKDWNEDRNDEGLLNEHYYDEDYTKIYRFTLIPLDGSGYGAAYDMYKKLSGASLTIENPAEGEAATVICGLDSNAKGFNQDSDEKPLIEKGGRMAVALESLENALTFKVKDANVSGSEGTVELCCYSEENTTVALSDGSRKTIPKNTWTKLRFEQDSVSDSEYTITADNELYVSSLRVTAK